VLEQSGRKVVSTDLIDRGYGWGGIDFLQVKSSLAKAIVTNPPWGLADAMVRHAAAIGVNYVAFLHKATWLHAQERGLTIETVWCPTREYQLLWRPDFRNQGGPPIDCSWYVFVRDSMRARSWSRSVLWPLGRRR
jgi:hypothetical protein